MLTLTGSTISHNNANGNGGGVWNDSTGTFALTGGFMVTENTAGQFGGDIFNSPGGTLVNCISGVNVTGNTPRQHLPVAPWAATAHRGEGPPRRAFPLPRTRK